MILNNKVRLRINARDLRIAEPVVVTPVGQHRDGDLRPEVLRRLLGAVDFQVRLLPVVVALELARVHQLGVVQDCPGRRASGDVTKEDGQHFLCETKYENQITDDINKTIIL